MNFTCFKSPDPAALNATKLYDFEDNDHNLWIRPSPEALPVCSSLHPSGSPCRVCRWDQVAFAVCQNLSDSVKMTMEGYGLGGTQRPIDLEKTACPQLITEGEWSWGLPLIIFIILAVVIVLAVVCWKQNKGPNAGQQPQDDPAVKDPINESPA